MKRPPESVCSVAAIFAVSTGAGVERPSAWLCLCCDDPANALEQMTPIENAVQAIPELDPLERADNRLKALTNMYQTEPLQDRR